MTVCMHVVNVLMAYCDYKALNITT